MITTMMVIAGTAVAVGCLLIGAMLYVLYDKLTRVIVAAVEIRFLSICNKIRMEADHTNKTIMREYRTMTLDIKHIKRSIPNVISHLYDIERSKLFGARLKAWRHKLQMTQKDVFNRTGISIKQISAIERGMSPSEDERGILSRMMADEALAKDELKPDGALEFEKKENELEV